MQIIGSETAMARQSDRERLKSLAQRELRVIDELIRCVQDSTSGHTDLFG